MISWKWSTPPREWKRLVIQIMKCCCQSQGKLCQWCWLWRHRLLLYLLCFCKTLDSERGIATHKSAKPSATGRGTLGERSKGRSHPLQGVWHTALWRGPRPLQSLQGPQSSSPPADSRKGVEVLRLALEEFGRELTELRPHDPFKRLLAAQVRYYWLSLLCRLFFKMMQLLSMLISSTL